MKTIKIAAGVIAAAGTAIGILFAPARGSLTRKSILHKGEEKADTLKKTQ